MLSAERSNANIFIAAAAAALVALVVGFAVYAYQNEKKRNFESFAERVSRETAQSAIDVENRITTLDLVVNATSNHITQAERIGGNYASTGNLRPYLIDITQELSTLRTVVVIDPQGIVTDDLREGQPGRGIDVSDRAYFMAHLSGGVDGTFIADPVVSRVDGKWTWTLSTAARDASGKLLAVVLASVDENYFQDIFNQSAPTQGLEKFLLHVNGTVLEASAQHKPLLGTKIDNLPLIETVKRDGAIVSSSIEGPLNRQGFLVAAQSVESWPAVVVNLLSRKEIDAQLSGFLWLTFLAAGVISMMIASAAMLMIGFVGMRAASEAAIRESETKFRSAFQNAALGNLVFGKDGVIQMCNATAEKIFGNSANGVVGENAAYLFPEARGKDFGDFIRKFMVTASSGSSGIGVETTALRKDGNEFPISLIASEMSTRQDGLIIGSFTDLTELKSLQEQVFHVQRLEAVGQLTGGIAHEFNNILAVVMGNAELLKEQAELTESSEAMAGIIVSSAERGAQLTQRLLAFSRKQSLKPQVLEIDELVTDMVALLTPTLGESIRIEARTPSGIWNAYADRGQVEAALLNLAINAQHAMPDGGGLLIECANQRFDRADMQDGIEVRAGDYVVLSVTDQGTGMSVAIKNRAFEPFFTTKDVGQGSGLGLSMVFGFAQQSGGYAAITSEQGKGTTVSIYLPRARDEETAKELSRERQVSPGGGEIILVIEDDLEVRNLAESILESLGYKVFGVPDALGAREALSRLPPVSLILSDIVLPGGVSGPQFVDEIRPEYPDIKIIFMSGYAAHAAKHHSITLLDEVVLRKPFRKSQLAEAVRAALE